MAYSNSIALVKKFLPRLDEVYKYASKSAILDSDGSLFREGVNANEIAVAKISMDGQANYSRNAGFVDGAVTLSWETKQYNYDRGRMFQIDSMDNEETIGIAFGRLASEYIRTKVTPEMDAVRFAKYAGTANIGSATGTLSTGADVISALRTATSAMDDEEVPMEDRYLFITSALNGAVEDLDTTKSREVMSRFSSVIIVPQTRFYTKVTLYDGTTGGQTDGGYVRHSDGKNINFMVISKSAILQTVKHTVNKIITPEQNQNADAWKFGFRAYALNDMYDNKKKGVYVHHVSANPSV